MTEKRKEMKGFIGLWKTYRPGEIYTVLGKLVSEIVREGKTLKLRLLHEERLHSMDELYRVLKRYETQNGIFKLMDLLGHGLELEGEPAGPRIRVFLRFPEGRQREKSLFKDLVAVSMTREAFSFTDRYFREQRNVFLHTRLETLLKKRFGFRFEYKVIVEPTEGN